MIKIIQECESKIKAFIKKLNPNDLRIRLEQIDFISNSDTSLWNNPAKATKLMKERSELEETLLTLKRFEESVELYKEFVNEPGFEENSGEELILLKQQIDDYELKLMFDKPEDKMGAIVSISSGAGGSEASNWVFMLLRMYLRYCEKMGWKTEILDEHRSEENSSICIDNITIGVKGDYAYGNLRAFNGVMRLIRHSPFSSADARHTSFAAVQVVADIDDDIVVDLKDKDYEIIPQTRGGPGGQNSNRVCSAARFKHFKTGISFIVSNERDFHQNKEIGIKMLRSKLYNLELEKRQKEEDARLGAQADNAFGSQIMTFTFSPYTLAADHRSNHKVNDVQSVLDGNLSDFVRAYLQK